MTELLKNQLVQLAIIVSISISILWAIKYFIALLIEKRNAK